MNQATDHAAGEPFRHAAWCSQRDQPAVEAHVACVRMLGTVIITTDARIDLRLLQHRGVPAFLALVVSERGRSQTVPLNVENAHRLEALLQDGLDNMTA